MGRSESDSDVAAILDGEIFLVILTVAMNYKLISNWCRL